jgi:hypothetical protein
MSKTLTLPGMASIRPRTSTEPGFKRQKPEYWEQVALFKFLDLHTRRFPVLGTVFAVPNGLALLPGVAGQAVAQGVKRGIWDICCPVPRWVYEGNPLYPEGEVSGHLYPSLFIEMKVKPNKLTLEQEGFRSLVTRYSNEDECPCFVVAYDWLQAARAIVAYLGIEDESIKEVLR